MRKKREIKMPTLVVAGILSVNVFSPDATASAANTSREKIDATQLIEQGAAKKVSVNFNGVTVKTVLDAIKKQTGLNFIYSTDLAKTWPKVNVHVRERRVTEVMNDIMSQINCRYDIQGNLVTITRRVNGMRVRTVTGYVTDDSGEPLPGVSICIDDSKVCTITDSKGFYTLKVPANDCNLRYSYLGMNTAVVPLKAGHSQLQRDVRMESDNQIGEVVVTG